MKTWGEIYRLHLKRGEDHAWAARAADEYMRRKGYKKCKCGRHYQQSCSYCATIGN